MRRLELSMLKLSSIAWGLAVMCVAHFAFINTGFFLIPPTYELQVATGLLLLAAWLLLLVALRRRSPTERSDLARYILIVSGVYILLVALLIVFSKVVWSML